MKHLKTFETLKYKSKFNIGDKVYCISSFERSYIEIGKIYTISDIEIAPTLGVFIKLEEFKELEHDYNQDRFILGTPENIKKYKDKLELKKNIDKYNL